ncbi:AMP-binding protein [Pseudomonas songnenensis]|uniref:Acyl-CoA synthetase n=1 Tax=Pseudomonas songnenensis TaxID=1176259 RepID=A0A482U6X8_9PSED|nr:AMP-binding protein [Pseudomonas songnenensis]RYJ62959.1 acyl-CoA synthetase [Pseudomonas songnenensis]
MTHDLDPAVPRSGAASPVLGDAAANAGATTLHAALVHAARMGPEQPAVVSTRFAPLDHRGLQQMIEQTRRQLRLAGFGRDARIGVLLPEAPQAAVAIIAIACSAVAVPLDPRLGTAELDQFLKQLPLDALLIGSDGDQQGRAAAERHGLTLISAEAAEDGTPALLLDMPVAAQPAADELPLPDAPAFILRSSGTTALPKLIPFTHRNMLTAARKWQRWFGLAAGDRCLCVSAPYYSHGLKVTILTPLLTGGSVAFPLSPAVVDLHEWFEALRPSWYSAGPALHRAVLEAATTHPEGLGAHRPRFASSGGAPLGQDIIDAFEQTMGFPLLEHYGSSEAAQIAVNTPAERKSGSVGRPWPETLSIVDEQGLPVPSGQRGEIRVRGATVMPGYLGDAALNDVLRDGWFHTGDIGSLDEDGFLYLHGRLREVINRGGEKVSLPEVDAALLRHPAVADAAAFAVPHPRLGQDVAAAVVLHPQMSVSPNELQNFLRGELVYFKVPRRVQVIDALPRGLTGKVLRHRLADAYVEQRSERARQAGASEAASPLEQQVLALWRRLLKTEAVGPQDNFLDCGGDSLLATEMLTELEQMLGRVIPESVLVEAETARELAERLENLAAHVIPVIDFNAQPGRTALFWFHGDFAHGGYYIRRLARLLGSQQPLTAIAPHGMGDEPIPESVQQMARERLPLILERQPEGPYRIGGYCNGALVAFEAARLLIEAGHSVEIVALIDPPTANVRPWSRAILRTLDRVLPDSYLARAYEALSRFGETSKWPYPKRLANLAWKLTHRSTRMVQQRLAGHVPPPPTARDREVRVRFLQYSLVMARYLPQRIDAPVVYFSADYTSRAWRNMGASFESYDVLGGHHRCVKDYTASIATPLRALLEDSAAPMPAQSGLRLPLTDPAKRDGLVP